MYRIYLLVLGLLLSLPLAADNNPFNAASGGTTVVQGLKSTRVGEIRIISANPGDWKFSASIEAEGDKEVLTIVMDSPTPAQPADFKVFFSIPQKGVFNVWTSKTDFSTHLDPFWSSPNYRSSFAYCMPLYSYFDDNENNCLTIACSEALRRVDAKLGVLEEGCEICSELQYFNEPEAPLTHYTTQILLDARHVFWSESIAEAAEWMTNAGDFEPSDVPDAAFEPLYSTWYQFHQQVTDESVLAECRLAADLGMKTVILDDGWQTDNTWKGYSWCGDWRPALSKFPDMAAHVARVQELGMKYMVWYSVPYVGRNSDAYSLFRGKFLREDGNAAILDPRFPEVREYLIGTYVKALKEWNLDGFKLDFIDEFRFNGPDPAVAENYAGRDILNVSEAVNVLMKDVYTSLRAIKPDILLEFRQAYIGPAVRQFGNMFRAADCPGNAADNRKRIANLRLTSGSTAVHSDMLEWNLAETPENVGRTIISSIFGVIQYSVMLENLPQPQADVVRQWMAFAREHRETLLRSEFRPRHPELNYPVIEAESVTERIVAVFQDNVIIERGDRSKKFYVLNASGSTKVRIEQPNGKIITVEVPCGGWSAIK